MRCNLFLCILLLPLAAALSGREPAPPSPDRVHAAIALAAEYLVTNAQKNGEFTYRRNLDPAVRYRYKYNVLRHAGTLYALGNFLEYRRETPAPALDAGPGDEKTIAVIRRGNAFLDRCLHPVAAHDGMLAVWSAEEKMDIRALQGSPLVAKLGASGLGILALCAVPEPPAADTREKMRKIALFIRSMQEKDGSFVSRLIAGKVDDDDFNSLYYPGEVMLALLTLYQYDPDPLWLETVVKGMKFLAADRRAANRYPPDHWVLLASHGLWRIREKWATAGAAPTVAAAGLTEAELCEHAARICQGMLAEQTVFPCLPGEEGCFRLGGLTCPTATRVEGLVSAYAFLPPLAYGDLRARIKTACTRAVNFLLKAQIPDGPLRGGVPRSSTADVLRYAPAERARANEVRIDYVQHMMCGLMLYQRWMGQR